MTKQPEALRIADVLIGSPQFTGTPIWQAADMLRRQHTEITALRNALEQSAVEPVAWIKTSDQYPPAGVRVFWFNPQYNHVGYDTWMGQDYKFNAEYWMHIPDIAPQAQQPTAQCKHCTKFFSAYRCNASQGECDCPQCQGLCTCSQQTKVTE